MVDNSVPNAPLTHADPTEHRRLIADRANAIGYEEGVWTPTFDFDVTGDLIVTYATQVAFYWRIGTLLFFDLHCQFTPTFTTSSGNSEIDGLPYQLKSDHPINITNFRLQGPNVTWPLSDIVGFIRPGEQRLVTAFQGSLSGGNTMDASEIGSGIEMHIRANGFYPID